MSKKINFFLTQRGFTSEIISLIYSISYAKNNGLQLSVNDRFWNSISWSAYFEPNCSFSIDRHFNLIYPNKPKVGKNYKEFLFNLYVIYTVKTKSQLTFRKGLRKYLSPIYTYLKEFWHADTNNIELMGNYLFYSDLESTTYWKAIMSFTSENQKIQINQVEFLLSDYLSNIARDIWRVKKSVKTNLFIPGDYISIHIRRGDKLIQEAQFVETEVFINIIEEQELENKTIFISSDDYSAIREFQEMRPNWKIIGFTEEVASGHLQKDFNNLSKEKRYEETKKFINEIDIHVSSTFFIGSITSNVSKLISLLRNDATTTYSVDNINSPVFENFYKSLK